MIKSILFLPFISLMFNCLINVQTLKIDNQISGTKNRNILKNHDMQSMVLIDNIIGLYKSREISYVTNNRGDKVPSQPRIIFKIERVKDKHYIEYTYNGDGNMSCSEVTTAYAEIKSLIKFSTHEFLFDLSQITCDYVGYCKGKECHELKKNNNSIFRVKIDLQSNNKIYLTTILNPSKCPNSWYFKNQIFSKN